MLIKRRSFLLGGTSSLAIITNAKAFWSQFSTAGLPTTPTMQLFGINVSASETSPSLGQAFPNTTDWNYFAAKGIPFIRLPIAWESLQPALLGTLNSSYLSSITSALAAGAARNVGVIVDLHNFGQYAQSSVWNSTVSYAGNGGLAGTGVNIWGDGTLTTAAFANVWSQLAAVIAGSPGLIGYELMNEPTGVITQATCLTYFQAAINAVRAVDPNTPIYIDGAAWGSAASWPSSSGNFTTLTGSNIQFDGHAYFDAGPTSSLPAAGPSLYSGTYTSYGITTQAGVTDVTPYITWLQSNGKLGFVGEFNVPNNTTDANASWITLQNNFLAYLAANRIPATIWEYTSAGLFPSNGLNVSPQSTANNGSDDPRLISMLSIGRVPIVVTVSGIYPASGAIGGSTALTITGTQFTAGATVTIGGTPATSVTVVSPTRITCVTPAGPAGTASVVVTTSAGSSAANSLFSYINQGGGVIANIPLGSTTITYQFTNSGQSYGETNADGSAGWHAGAWSDLGFIFNFPANDIYEFTIPCYTPYPTSGFPANGVRVYIDQFVAQTVTPNTYYFDVFVSNAAPSANITFSCPVLSGNHEVLIEFLTVAPVHTSSTVHADRIIITQMGIGLPAEPVGTRDITQFPLSCYSYWNTSISNTAQWSLLTDSDTQALINGLPSGLSGGSPTVIPSTLNINSSSFSSPIYIGTPTNPSWTVTASDNFDTPALSQPFSQNILAPATMAVASGSDVTIAVVDGSNNRYSYGGGGTIPTGTTDLELGRMTIVDSFNQNPGGTNQADGYIRGIIRVGDITQGVIAHTINIAICANITATVLTQKASGPPGTGLGWPCDECDYNGPFGEFTGGAGAVQWGALLGIPGSVNLSSLGLTTSLGMMVAVALQNYGANIEGQVGNYNSSIIMYAEYAVSQNSATSPLLNAWYSSGDPKKILAQMRILRNNTPAAFNNGYAGPPAIPNFAKGGGTPRVPMLAGIPSIANYPSRHAVSSAPVVTAAYPNRGTGDTLVAIVGSGFTGATAVTLGGAGTTPASPYFTVVNDTQINAYMPFHSNGARVITVTTPSGSSSGSVTFTHGVVEIQSIPLNPDLPNPYLFNDPTLGYPNPGTSIAVTTKAQWALKWFELREAWSAYWLGHMPPPSAVSVTNVCVDQTITTTIGANNTMRQLQVNLQTASGIVFGFNMYIPLHSGAGPFPILFYGGWAFSPLIAVPVSGNTGNSLGQNNLNTLVNRGYILAEMSLDQFSLDQGDTSPVEAIFTLTTRLDNASGGYAQEGTGFSGTAALTNPGPGNYGGVGGPANQVYATYGLDRNCRGSLGGPNATFPSWITSSLGATVPFGAGGVSAPDLCGQTCWIWGTMRAIDYLVQCSASGAAGYNAPVDTQKICVTGISHDENGFIAAAYDPRIAACLTAQGLGIFSGSRLCEFEGNFGDGLGLPNQNPQDDGSGLISTQDPPRWLERSIGPPTYPTQSLTEVWQNYLNVPIDNNALMAMIAANPLGLNGKLTRGFMSVHNYLGGVSPYGGSPGIDSARACSQKFLAGATAWTALGDPTVPWCNCTDDHSVAANGHQLAVNQWTAMLNYMDHYFKGTALPADVAGPAGSYSYWCQTAAQFISKLGSGGPIYANGTGRVAALTTPPYSWTPPSSLT